MLGAGLFQKEEVSGMRGPLPAPATAGDVSGDGRMSEGPESARGPIDTCLLSEPGTSGLMFCVLGMSIDYRVKVPNSPAGGKSQRISRWSE